MHTARRCTRLERSSCSRTVLKTGLWLPRRRDPATGHLLTLRAEGGRVQRVVCARAHDHHGTHLMAHRQAAGLCAGQRALGALFLLLRYPCLSMYVVHLMFFAPQQRLQRAVDLLLLFAEICASCRLRVRL